MKNCDKLHKNGKNGMSPLPFLSVLNEKMRAYLLSFYLYTFMVWALMMAYFFTNGRVIMITSLNDLYVGLLTAYLAQKEVIRWWIGKNSHRIWGELWVYIWLGTGLLLWPLASVFPETFKHFPDTQLAKILGFVFAYFSISETSKRIYNVLEATKKKPKA